MIQFATLSFYLLQVLRTDSSSSLPEITELVGHSDVALGRLQEHPLLLQTEGIKQGGTDQTKLPLILNTTSYTLILYKLPVDNTRYRYPFNNTRYRYPLIILDTGTR